MNTLKNHLILFDADCPMCSLYTKVFINTGLLEKDGRAAYQDFSTTACPLLDRQRAVNEIALVNQETGEVSYGISSLFKVIATGLPFLKPLFSFQPFVWLMSKAYAFVSYNRRVIIPPTVKETGLQPTFRLDYRILYLTFTWVMTAYILSQYTPLMTGLLPAGPVYREYLVCGGQILFQGLVISLINSNKRWEYLGNMMTISFAGALLLAPGIIIANWLHIAPIYYAIWFMFVAGLMFLEHIRRAELLELGWVLTTSWVTYRIIILLLILQN